MKSQDIEIDKIVTDGGTQMRVSLLESTVDEYHAILAESTDWPFDSPLIVFHDGTDYYLADGFHRFMAAKRAGRPSVRCHVIAGSLRDAVKFSLGANARHGLRRTNDDKRKAVGIALDDQEWRNLSSRAIAEICGVSHPFVESLRKQSSQVVTVSTEAEVDEDDYRVDEVPEKRVGRNGVPQLTKKAPAKTKEKAAADPSKADTVSDIKPAKEKVFKADAPMPEWYADDNKIAALVESHPLRLGGDPIRPFRCTSDRPWYLTTGTIFLKPFSVSYLPLIRFRKRTLRHGYRISFYVCNR